MVYIAHFQNKQGKKCAAYTEEYGNQDNNYIYLEINQYLFIHIQ